MKKYTFIIVLMLVGTATFAAGLFNQNTPSQSLSVTAPGATSSKSTASDFANSSAKGPNTNSDTKAKALSPAGAANFDSSAGPPVTSQVGQQLSSLTQQVLLFNQQTDGRVDAIQTKVTDLNQRLGSVIKAFQMLNVQVQRLMIKQSPLSAVATPAHTDKSVGTLSRIGQYFGSMPAYFLLGIIVILLLTILYLLLPGSSSEKKPQAAAVEVDADDDTEQEYDFMGSKEGMPAKLDLARAYLAMQDYVQAKEALQTVLERGTPEQQQVAQQLFKTIPEG